MTTQFQHGIETIEVDNGVRPIQTVKSSVILIVGTAPDDQSIDFNTPALLSGPRAAAELGDAGTLKDGWSAAYQQGAGTIIVIKVPEDADAASTKANIIGDPAEQTGIWAAVKSSAMLGLIPRLLVAPGFARLGTDGGVDPVVAALSAVADKLRAIGIIDGPNSTETDAVTAAESYGSGRLYCVDPYPTVYDTDIAAEIVVPASAFVAGMISRRDNEKGFWWSPSNQIINGITGTSRAIGFSISDPDTEANRLNEAKIATIIRKDGFRLWGNRTLSSDPLWAFLSVRRTHDMVYESIEDAMLWAMDRPFSPELLNDIQGSVGGYLKTLKTRGAILNYQVWVDEELNTQETLKNGELYVSFDMEVPGPLEHLTFMAYRNGSYYEELPLTGRNTAA